ncbi:MAG: hypothetical protein ABIN89_06510, partial [Chitinophagaceae bacterium]
MYKRQKIKLYKAEELESLADKYLKNQCTPEEAKLVLDWFESKTGQRYLQDQLDEDTQLLQNEIHDYFSAGTISRAAERRTEQDIKEMKKTIEEYDYKTSQEQSV